jgi:glycosyltransferase involved in cell wall biosynthesis
MHEHDPNANLARTYELPERFIFYPAQFWAHKNHLRLIEAVRRLRAEFPDLHLVLAGSKKNGFAAVERKVSSDGLEGVVHFLGFVPESDLAMLYRRAVALVLPTFFGPTNIPPLEAFVVGCPVAASGIYGMPEQLGDAALYFDPLSVDEIVGVLRRLWTDNALRTELGARGRARSAAWGAPQFNQRFATIIEALLGEDRRTESRVCTVPQ